MKKLIIIFALGAFASLAMAPNNFWPALFVGLSSLYIFTHKAPTPLKSGLVGFIFSLGYFGFSLSWIGNALLIEDNPYWWAWPLAVSGLPIILALFTATACYIHKLLCKNHNNFATYLIFTILITISEYARGHLFTGFPWNLYGYTWIDIMPIAQTAALWNAYLLTSLTIFWASAPAFLLTSTAISKMKICSALIIISSFMACYVFGLQRIENYSHEYMTDYEAVIIQPNIKQSEKWKQENRSKNFMKQIELSKYDPLKNSNDVKAYYIIWPETAISQDLLDSSWAINIISDMLQTYPDKAYLITGALRHDGETNSYFNSVITFNNNAKIINTYNKSHLVPFGEYMPFDNIFNISPIVGFTGFKKGNGVTTVKMPEGISFSPLICYEIIFSNKVINKERDQPDFIVNVTNDAWYEGSAGPHQHLTQSKFRAIETGLPILRSANTGISAIINPLGHNTIQEKESEKLSFILKIPTSILNIK